MRNFLQWISFAVLGLALAGAAPAHAQKTITCSSDDGHRHSCHVDARGGVQMVNQRSGAACQQGYSWGYDRNGVWVDHGCRADFMVQSYSKGAGGNVISCASDDGGRHTCQADVRGGVQLVNQRSGSACKQGYSWGTGPGGIWVDHGCRADFMVQSGGWNGAGGQTISCSSDGGRKSCSANTLNGVQLVKQRSDARCQMGYSWGYDQNGIWVDHGCRADFQTGGGQGMPGTQPFGMEQTVSCASDNGGRRTCPATVRNGVTLIKQRSDKPCQQGYSWGYDQNGIWVDHGCRADFAVR